MELDAKLHFHKSCCFWVLKSQINSIFFSLSCMMMFYERCWSAFIQSTFFREKCIKSDWKWKLMLLSWKVRKMREIELILGKIKCSLLKTKSKLSEKSLIFLYAKKKKIMERKTLFYPHKHHFIINKWLPDECPLC